MFTRFERFDRLYAMIWNGCVDVNSMNVGVFQQLIVICKSLFNPESVSNLIQF
jgi:hypothetical protein